MALTIFLITSTKLEISFLMVLITSSIMPVVFLEVLEIPRLFFPNIDFTPPNAFPIIPFKKTILEIIPISPVITEKSARKRGLFFLSSPLPSPEIPFRVSMRRSCRFSSVLSFSLSTSSVPTPPFSALPFLIFIPIKVPIDLASILTALFALRPLSANLEKASMILNMGSIAGPVSNLVMSFINGVRYPMNVLRNFFILRPAKNPTLPIDSIIFDISPNPVVVISSGPSDIFCISTRAPPRIIIPLLARLAPKNDRELSLENASPRPPIPSILVSIFIPSIDLRDFINPFIAMRALKIPRKLIFSKDFAIAA